ncbi:F-box/FBD/LRR-repeat protein At5g22660-like [Aegilops tauschii subsp. strangulata]|nr:F-box/FBD/LRR-repeat protein At5g22660-like [Aegilops tauschii subsp. strangulata]
MGWEEASSPPCSSPRPPAPRASTYPGVILRTRHLFDEMHKKAVDTGMDPFRVLSDDVLEHILSLMPGDEALQTCVLSTQWRDLWRRKTNLRFIFENWSSFSRERFNKLAKLIIHLRGDASLTNCQINPYSDEDYINFTEAKPLVEYALKCRVEKLSICASDILYEPLLVDDSPLISRHLRTIEFRFLDLVDSSVDFSGCPVLEELTIERCYVDAEKICSNSLKHLRLVGNCTFSEDIHIPIAAPRLISLELGSFQCLSPFLEEMPLLEKASILLGNGCYNVCHSDRKCGGCSHKKCLLLNGLSNAVDLKLIAAPELPIFKRDLEWCPEFDKLKTLKLNDWFTATDLVCILQHSPNLEKLTLKIDFPENFVGGEGSRQSFVCPPHLVVNIKCRKVDNGVCKILDVLRTCGILLEQISIKCRDRT